MNTTPQKLASDSHTSNPAVVNGAQSTGSGTAELGSLVEGPLPAVVGGLVGEGSTGVIDTCAGGVEGVELGDVAGEPGATMGPLVLEGGVPAPGMTLEPLVG